MHHETPIPSPRQFPRPGSILDGAAVVWMRGDLRVHDHAALRLAANSGRAVAPLYILPTKKLDAFEAGALLALRSHLHSLGTTLYVRRSNRGTVADTVARFAQDARARVVYTHRGTSKEERAEEKSVCASLRSAGMQLEAEWDSFLRSPDKHPFKLAEMPTNCDEYARRLDNEKVTEALPAPQSLRGLTAQLEEGVIPQDSTKPIPRDAGEAGAWRRLCAYATGSALADVDPSVPDHKSLDTTLGRLGPFISLGCISPRALYYEVRRKVPKMSIKFYCAELELVLNDFFKMMQLKEQLAPAGTQAMS